MTPESLVKRQICQYLARIPGCFFWISDRIGVYDPVKNTFRTNKDPFRIKGVSDILGIYKGHALAIEVKATEKSKRSPEQKEFIKNFTEHGGLAFFAWSVESVHSELIKWAARGGV